MQQCWFSLDTHLLPVLHAGSLSSALILAPGSRRRAAPHRNMCRREMPGSLLEGLGPQEKKFKCNPSPERVGAGGRAQGAEAARQHLGLTDGLHVGADLAAVPRPPHIPLHRPFLRAATH